MSPRGWATGTSRKLFLDEHGLEYQKAVESGSNLPNNVEPVEGDTYEEPTTPDRIKEKGSQIKGIIWWYGLHWSTTCHSGNTLVTPTLGPVTIWWGGKYSKALLLKPRIKHLEQVYSSLYYETKIQPEHEEALAVWDEAQKVPETVEQLQKGINNMIPFITEFMCDLRTLTGMSCSVIVGGPSLATEGELTVTHLHEGKTVGDQPGSHVHNLFLSSIIPSYVEFLKLVYLQSECLSRFSPGPEQSPTPGPSGHTLPVMPHTPSSSFAPLSCFSPVTPSPLCLSTTVDHAALPEDKMLINRECAQNKELIKELGLKEPLIPSPMDKGKKKADHSFKCRAADIPEGSTCPNTWARQIANSTAFPTIPPTPVAPVQDVSGDTSAC
ncbi:hypothetical protein BS47DRAFT_1361002 [Hydnum rufescens UP504]|uniref:Uncharacterized protein n=1 Tax=Hydnum rufescens UP504 TaxID=1448309 RepID=A0A9P6DYY6_9AGAM|nr:hypothetical protein BS47DRAFT_1361002 [Hydnum rufescens UP504]